MTKKLNDQLKNLKASYKRYQESKARLNRLKLETDILADLYQKQAEQVALQMRRQNLNEINTEDCRFKLRREIKTRITDRTLAEEYDQQYQLGLFQKTICGMRLKAWVNQQLEKNLKIPDFIAVSEVWTIDIQ